MERHDLLEGRVYVFKRPRSPFWQCGTFLHGKKHRKTTDLESLGHAKDYAEKWYFDLRSGVTAAGTVAAVAAVPAPAQTGKTFADAAAVFKREYEVITDGERNAHYVQRHWQRLAKHILPFFGPLALPEVTSGKAQEYRVHRLTPPLDPDAAAVWKRPARSTLHQETVVIRQVLKTAYRHGWIQSVPDLSPPFRASEKVAHRAWFSPDEYELLYKATRLRVTNPKPPFKRRWKWEAEQPHDYVLFMANTGLRPDEAARLEYRDVQIVWDHATRETILDIEARGKRGFGHCKSTPNAVRPFRRLLKRNNPQPTDRVFPSSHRELFNAILDELNLKTDRDGNRRTAYSLRHTYICFRLNDTADIYQIAKNCRTSVEMIEKHYAVHLKNTLDAGAINRRRPRAHKRRRDPRLKRSRGPRTKPVG